MTDKKQLTERQYQGWTISAALKKPAYRLQLVKRCRSEDFVGADRILFDGLSGQETHGKFDILAYQKAIGDEGKKRLTEIEGEFLLMPDEFVFDDWIKNIIVNAQRRRATTDLQLAMDRIKKGEAPETVYGDLALSLYREQQRVSSNMLPLREGVNQVRGTIAKHEAGDPYIDLVPTGFARIDRILRGMSRKNVTSLAGRPGSGKTQWALQVSRNVALWARSRKRDSVVIIFSAEMSLQQLTMRLASCASGVPSDAIRDNTATPEQKEAFNKALEFMEDLPIVIDETPSPTTAQMFIRVAVEAMLHKDGVDMVVFDYLELAGDTSTSTEEARLGNIMRGLKIIAKCFNCAVLAISQLNRDVEKRESRIPEPSDLRGSGWIEALSQALVFIMRPEFYATVADNGTVEYPNTTLDKMSQTLGPKAARFEIPKNRDGGTGIAILRFDAPITRFYEDGDPTQATLRKTHVNLDSFVLGRDDAGAAAR